ncbi:hypothetical protein GQ55_3G449900 [Panicum hallii var. hallii]|uniref:No apical meristem-associated C-terminal domain-containing protein n=1 Tax=Panicum hallii var. hallii TaxID=1504633 RepID=A0A2T7EIF0_9POAL|nr:hypothetical protein GQ55_3G449900 [Panicum hallii var. hallii]
MPLQPPTSSPAPPAQNEPVATTVESVEAAVLKESQGDEEGALVAAGRRRKGVPSRSKLSNFSPKEDVFLVKSWLEISCDPIINIGQKKGGSGLGLQASTIARGSRWDTIKAESSKFAGYMANVLRDNPSGMSDADKDEPKWMELNIRGARPGDDDAIAEHIPAGATDIDHDLETPSSQYAGSKRPMGRDAAKRAAKKSASSSPSESSQYASKLQDLSIQKISIWEEENAKKGSRYEQRVAIEYEEVCQHNKHMVSIEEEKLQIMRKKADREQTHEEERILGIDLDKCNPRLRKYYEKKQQEILRNIGANEYDN